MAEIRISSNSNNLVLYFQTPEPQINAYALASTLVALADAAKAAGRSLNSAVDIEVVVEAIGSGSFRARVSAIARESGLFVRQQVLVPLIIGVLATYIYEHTLARRDPIIVQVETGEVIITQGNDRVIVPREVHEAEQVVIKNTTFVNSIDRMLDSVTIDDRVTGFGIAGQVDGAPPELVLPRELLESKLELAEPDEKERVVEEDCDLYIVKAIMERSNRKWEFRWRGVRISAPIKDPTFYEEFAKHRFTIAPGDEFQARLAIHQVRDDISGIYTNTRYEVVRVYRRISRPKAEGLALHAN